VHANIAMLLMVWLYVIVFVSLLFFAHSGAHIVLCFCYGLGISRNTNHPEKGGVISGVPDG
jgi:hypothetical protein